MNVFLKPDKIGNRGLCRGPWSLAILLTAVLLAALCAGAQTRLEAAAIARAKRLPVAQLDPGLRTAMPLEAWLKAEAGPGAKIAWESNDCGEQSGNPEADRGRDFPLCAEADLALSGGRKLVVMIAVGTFQRGLAGKPAVWFLELQEPGKPAMTLRSLRALQAYAGTCQALAVPGPEPPPIWLHSSERPPE